MLITIDNFINILLSHKTKVATHQEIVIIIIIIEVISLQVGQLRLIILKIWLILIIEELIVKSCHQPNPHQATKQKEMVIIMKIVIQILWR